MLRAAWRARATALTGPTMPAKTPTKTTVTLTETAISRGWGWNRAGDQIFCWQHRPLPDDLPKAVAYWSSVCGETSQLTVELQTAVAESNVFAGVNGPPRNREAFWTVMGAYSQWRLREDEIEATLQLCDRLLRICGDSHAKAESALDRLIHALNIETAEPHRKVRAIRAIGAAVSPAVDGLNFHSLVNAYEAWMNINSNSSDKRLFFDLITAAFRWQTLSIPSLPLVWRKSIEASFAYFPVPATKPEGDQVIVVHSHEERVDPMAQKPKTADTETIPGCMGRPLGGYSEGT